MKKYISKARYYLEFIALPAFLYLVVHLSGHGLSLFLDEGHEHEHGHTEAGHSLAENFIDSFFTVEVLSGILMLLLFVWIWHRPFMKKLVPCSHSVACKCDHKSDWPHIFATGAFLLHLFPEAGVRHVLLENLSTGEALTVIGLVAFAAHFLVDIIVVILLSSYWHKKGFIISLVTMVSVWLAALYFGEHIEEFLPGIAEGVLFLVSAFLLSMFVHKPHNH